MGSVQMTSSIARPHAATVATMGTCARQVPGSSTFQFLEKGIQRTETMMMEKIIQRTLMMLHARTMDGES